MSLFVLPESVIKTNARIKFLPNENGEYVPYEITCFDRLTYVPSGWESNRKKKSLSRHEVFEDADASAMSDGENKRKSFCRARNMLFDILLSTVELNCFVTLTCSGEKIDRYDYKKIVKSLSCWLDNRVRRNGLIYVLVPEKHKDGAVHFHGLMNKEALKLVRAVNPYTKKEMVDDKERPIFNIKDFNLGFTTVIPLSGKNARTATAKYCYKYIVKSKGEKVGGRYYLSGGKLGRPKYEYVNRDFDDLSGNVYSIGRFCRFKKIKL